MNEERLECGRSGVLYAGKGSHTLFTGQREKEAGREKETEREGGGRGERERERE